MKLKKIWTNSKPINYNDVLIASIPLNGENIFGVVYELKGELTYITHQKNKLLFLNPHTLEKTFKPLNIMLEKYVKISKYHFCYINNQLYFIALYRSMMDKFDIDFKVLAIVNLTTNEVFNHQYEYRLGNSLCVTCIDEVWYAIVAGNTNIDKWDIINREQVATHSISSPIFSPIYLFDTIIQISAGDKNDSFSYTKNTNKEWFNFDIKNWQPLGCISYEYEDNYCYSSKQIVQINGKWITILCGGRDYKTSIHKNRMFDTFTGKYIGEIPHDDIQNSAGLWSYIHYNKVGDPLLILSESFYTDRAFVYNLNHLDEGFNYLRDPDIRRDRKALFSEGERSGNFMINPNIRYLYDDYDYLAEEGVPTYFGDEPVFIDEKYGRLFSLETYQPMHGSIPAHKVESNSKNLGIYSAIPFTFPNNTEGYIINRSLDFEKNSIELWNPFGKERDLNVINHIYATNVKDKDVFVTVSANNTLSTYETNTNKLLAESDLYLLSDQTIEYCTVANVANQPVLVIILNTLKVVGNVVKKVVSYTLPDLQKRDLVIDLPDAEYDLFVTEFEGRDQLVTYKGGNSDIIIISVWDLETGDKTHQSLPCYDDQGELIEDNSGANFIPFRWNGELTLAITFIGGTLETLFLDIAKSKYINKLEFNAKFEKYFEEYTQSYDIIDIREVEIEGKKQLLTMSMNGVLAFFDHENFKQTGTIKNMVGYDYNSCFESKFIQLYTLDGQPLLILQVESDLNIIDLTSLKKLKTLSFEKGISAFTLSGNTLIVCSGEDISAINILA